MMNNVFVIYLFLLGCFASGVSTAAEDESELTFDGLMRVEGARVHSAYINPDADFSVFQRVAILDPHVAFRANWVRDQNRSRSGTRRVRESDAERIKEDMASLFKDVFTERLEAAGYEVVNHGGDDVLLLRPAIIDLDVTAPDLQTTGRTRTYTASTGAATLVLELFDSISGQIIGRAADRRGAGNRGIAMRANRVTNQADARRELRAWADKLIEFLDSHYAAAGDMEVEEDN